MVQLKLRGQLLRRPIQDLSEGGAQLLGHLPVGATVRLFVALPVSAGRRFRLCLLDGRVSWSGRGRSGVRFTNLTLEAVLLLREVISQALTLR